MKKCEGRLRSAGRNLLMLVAVGAAVVALLGVADRPEAQAYRQAQNWEERRGADLTLIQMGDLHGHLVPRPHLRSDGSGAQEGGLARTYTKIKEIRKTDNDALLFNVGDTIQGGAEVLYTRGQVMVDVLDAFGIDGYASGNWDFLYGTERYLEFFGDGRWGAVAANLYYDGPPYAEKTGQRVLPPYRVKVVDGVRVGIVGFTTERGPTVGGPVASGFRFTGDGEELPVLIDTLRTEEDVDVIVMLSELGLAKNVALAEKYPGVDVLLSQDMHEETPRAIVASTGTLVSEAGQDGTRLAEIRLQLEDDSVSGWRYKFHTIDESLRPDRATAARVDKARRPFVSGPGFKPHTNPINHTTLKKPINTVVGQAKVPLYRGNFSDERMPGVIEGSSHDFITDVFRTQARADVGIIRGFRYGTHVAPGPIKLEDLYHFIPVGPMVGRGTVTGQQIKTQIEASIDGSLNPDVFAWTGGWVFGYSGIRYDLDPYAARGERAQNILVFERTTGEWAPLDPDKNYTVAGYWYETEPNDVSGLKLATDATPIRSDTGEAMDATEVITDYLQTRPADPQLDRVRLLAPLPDPVYSNREIQPLQGVSSR